MTNKDDAVYQSNYDDNFAPEYGLTKREYFAAMAMQGILSGGRDRVIVDVVRKAVMYSDALLEELDKC